MVGADARLNQIFRTLMTNIVAAVELHKINGLSDEGLERLPGPCPNVTGVTGVTSVA
jgi:hypothetical protein